MSAPLSPFETFVVGSLPRPRWIQEVIEDRREGRLDRAAAGELLDAAVPLAVRLQERAGLDVVSDGEWRRESYVKVFSENVDGFATGVSQTRIPGAPPDMVVVAPLEQRRPIAANEASFVRGIREGPIVVALPSPYILAWRTWSPERSRDAYATREEFMAACIPILRNELLALAELGVEHVQIDEPWLLMLVDPAERERRGVSDVAHEIETCVNAINAMLDGVSGLTTSMHLCHGHFNRQRGTEGGYEPIIEALAEIRVERFAMEFAAPQSRGVSVLSRFPADKTLGLGVIDHCDPHVESPEEVVARVEAALEHIPPDRLTLNPDCGFAPGSLNPMSIDEAYKKLQSMCRGATLLRERYL
jgi:5-methyltetrahydropteroyltriglutamate--homocysteine methyltransferase